MPTPSRLDIACAQIQAARDYTLSLVDDFAAGEWFLSPPGLTTHLAWQVGHLAMAEYGLCLFRQRGRQPLDRELMPSGFRRQFSRGSEPTTESSDYPSPESLRATLDRVHQQVLLEVPTLPDTELDQPVDRPYAAYPTRYGALLFSAHHEMLHAGQIGMLRRLLGKPPLR